MSKVARLAMALCISVPLAVSAAPGSLAADRLCAMPRIPPTHMQYGALAAGQDVSSPQLCLRGGGTPMEWEAPDGQGEGLHRTIALMEQEMQQAAADMKFEDAARLRDAIEVLKQGTGKTRHNAAAEGEILTFDWERARGVTPIQVPPRVSSTAETPGRRAASPEDLSKWPASEAAFAEMVTDERVDQADRAMVNVLNAARSAMLRAETGDKLSLSEAVRAFDTALELMVEEGTKEDSGKLLTCLRLLQRQLASILKGQSRTVNLSAGDLSHMSPRLLHLAGEALLTIGFVPHGDAVDLLQLADEYPLYLLREAEGSLELKIGHLDPPQHSTPPPPGIYLPLEQRGVVLLVPPDGPIKLPEVPEDVYNFTARDLMDVLESNKKYYEETSTLMTSGMRQRRENPARLSNHSTCRVRVRLTDGAMVEATYDVREGINALVSVLGQVFVESSPEPVLTTMPPVRVLTQEPSSPAGERPSLWHTMTSLGLVPAGIINCRGLEGRRLDSTFVKPDIPVRDLAGAG